MSYCIVGNQFDSFIYFAGKDDEEVLVKPSKFETLVAGAIIGAVAVVLLSTCLILILLVINLNRLTGAAVHYKTEQSQHNPARALTEIAESRATVEGGHISQVAS